MADNETWYHVYEGQSIGPLTGHEMEALAEFGKITRETLVWPGAGEWVPAGSTRLAPFFGPRLVPDPVFPPAKPTWSDQRAAFFKDKPRLRVGIFVGVIIMGLYAVYQGVSQAREGFSEFQDASDPQPTLATTAIDFQGCRAAGPAALECLYHNKGRVVAKACMDVVVVCDDGRHVASSCSDPIAPGESSTKLIDNFSPPGVATATGCAPMEFENVRVR